MLCTEIRYESGTKEPLRIHPKKAKSHRPQVGTAVRFIYRTEILYCLDVVAATEVTQLSSVSRQLRDVGK